MLSLKVRDIVFREKKSSYKEVAEKLIENLNVNIGHPFNVISPIYLKFLIMLGKRGAKYQTKGLWRS